MKSFCLSLAALLLIGAGPAADDFGGHTLIVVSIRTGNTEVFVADPTTGDLRNISRTPHAAERYASWSPDGRQVAFTSDRDGAYNLLICGSRAAWSPVPAAAQATQAPSRQLDLYWRNLR